MKSASRERLEDLLVARALEGLGAGAAAELEMLLEAGGCDFDSRYEEAAARFWLGAGDGPRSLPPRTAGRVHQQLMALSGQRGTGHRSETPPPRPPPPDQARPVPRRARGGIMPLVTSPRSGPASFAAGLLLALAVGGWWPQAAEDSGPSREALAEARSELMEDAPDAVRVEWQAAGTSADGVTGHVVWSDARQSGFVTFRDMPVNDPAEYRYHVWVFDVGRNGRSPVRGGAFNAPGDGDEVIVPIANKLPITRAGRFAVTREPPGGAAFSSSDSLLLMARPGTASGT